ncbi:MAG: ABC transporter permease subunit [Acidobacteriota bacterium]|jgi:ABC-2 type transport system permease protein|nr:ABC transporter permease subunit [Acidobacteriota bacterium]
MKQIFNIFRKELSSYFVSPIAYIVIAIFLVVTGWFFFSTFFLYNQASMRGFFSLLPLIFAFVVPAVTMKLFSEEFNRGTHEMMMTLPLSQVEVVMGKFLAALGFILVMLLPTIVYAVTISTMGDLDPGPVVGGYLGAVLLGGLFAAIGLFASSLTRNQIIAFIIAMAICFFLTLIDKMLFFLPKGMLNVMSYLGADYHFRNIARGVLDSRDLLYFISMTFIALYGTQLVIQERK